MAPDTAPSHDTKKPLATHDWKVVLVPVKQHSRFIYRFKADKKSYPSVPSRPKTGRVVLTESTIEVRCLVLTTRWIDVIYRVKARAIFNLRKLIGERWIFESYYSEVDFVILRLTLYSFWPYRRRQIAVKLLSLVNLNHVGRNLKKHPGKVRRKIPQECLIRVNTNTILLLNFQFQSNLAENQ